MNRILYEKLVALPILTVELEHLYLPDDGVQKCLWDFLNEINFLSPIEFWNESEHHILMDYPIYITQKSAHKFQIISGYRIISIAKLLDLECVSAIDISELSHDEHDEIAIHFALFPLLLWTTKTNHLDTNLKKFVKNLFKAHPNTKRIAKKYAIIGKSTSRFKGRTQEKPKSKLSKFVAERIKNK